MTVMVDVTLLIPWHYDGQYTPPVPDNDRAARLISFVSYVTESLSGDEKGEA